MSSSGGPPRPTWRPRHQLVSIVVIAAAVALAYYTFVVDQGTITDRERGDRQHDVFPAYRRADIDSIELVHTDEKGSRKLRIERRVEARDARDPGDPYWQMTAPVDERADPSAVDRFVGDLEFAGAIRKVDPAAAEVSRAFEGGRVRATGTLAMKKLVYHFALGGSAPLPEGAAYFRVDGEGTFVVSKDFVASVMNGADAYRDRTVVPYLSLDLAGLLVTTPGPGGGTLEVTRVDDVSFKLKGSGLRASREGMDRVWGGLAEARASSFLSDGDADRAIGASPVSVVMTPKDAGKPKGELRLGGACPGHEEDVVFIRVAPTRVSACVPKGALAGLSVPESSLVDRHLFAARSDETEELILETVAPAPPFAVELARMGKGWHERRPTDRELGPSEVELANGLVTKLTRAEASAVDAAGQGAQGAATSFTPRSRARLKRGGGVGGAEEVVELQGTDLVRRAFDGAVLHVSPDLGRRLWPDEIVLRGRSVFEAAAASVGQPVSLSTDCDGVHQALTRDGGQWVLHEPRGFTADPLTTADLAGLILHAQAESWVTDRDDGSFGLEGSKCRIELASAAEGGPRKMGIVFGKEVGEAGGGFYARTTTDPAVFIATAALREGGTTWLIDRSGFHADRPSIESVTLSSGAAHAVLQGPASATRDAGKRDAGAKAFEAIESLRPEIVLHLGPPKPAEGLTPPLLDVRVKVAGSGGKPAAREIHFTLGDTTMLNRERVVYARLEGVDATFAVPRERVAVLFDALPP